MDRQTVELKAQRRRRTGSNLLSAAKYLQMLEIA